MPLGLSNKDGRIFFIKIVSHTFTDKEAHKRIIYEYILKVEITESNNVEGFQRELRRHIKQYDVIQGNEWKKITNHIIIQYHKIESPPFQTGFNMQVVTGPTKVQTKYSWICTLLEWTNTTRHNIITRNLWPKPKMNNNQELNTMPMHEHKWGTDNNSWGTSKDTAKAKPWPDSSTKQTTSRWISTATTADRSNIRYNPYWSTHVFTKVKLDTPKPTENVWIGTSHIFLPTFWCSKCDGWYSHHDKLHDERLRWQAMKNAQLSKQEEYRKQSPQNHYGTPYLQNISFSCNENNKRPNNLYDCENYQDKRSHNDRGRVDIHPDNLTPNIKTCQESLAMTSTHDDHHSATQTNASTKNTYNNK
jgi:hypothetical protein